MLKLARQICKYKHVILIIAILLLIPSLIGMKATRTNYDILTYLPNNIDTVKGEDILTNDFNMGSYAIVITKNMSTRDVQKLEDKIKDVDHVANVASVADVIGTNIPEDMLPNEVKDAVYKDGETPIMVTFDEGISSDNTLKAIQELRKVADKQCMISSMSALVVDTKDISDSQVPIYVIVAVVLCMIVLQLALDSYVAPIFILLNIGMAIVYNMGTNVIFGEISYITKAISAVLQLGVTTDFSIFLYHSYEAEKKKFDDKNEAMAHAIAETFTSVLGSSLTTIAGFLALCSMQLTLGKDIGLVMAKGVLLGVIAVVTILPAMVLIFDKPITKTSHKPLLPQFIKWRDFNVKHYIAIVIVALLILPFALYGYKNIDVYYDLNKTLPQTLPSIEASNELKDKFNMVSTDLILVDKDVPSYKVNEMIEKIRDVDGVNLAVGYSSIEGKSLPSEMVPDKVKNLLENDQYQLVVVSSEYDMATDEINSQLDKINDIVKQYDDKALVAGEAPLMKDLVEISDHDFNSVNTVSMVVIFIIMVFVLRSISLPIILMAVIEFAICLNMGISTYTHTSLPFVASIVIGTIQLGATIDYAILITTKYIKLRKDGNDKKTAVTQALGTSINSIVTSALCFFAATIGVSIISDVGMISSLCTLMARGAIISMFSVIMILPAMLLMFDKLVCKTTVGMKNVTK